jgi:hypothetical protein
MHIKFQHKICYNQKLNFLKLKSTPSKSIACRITKRGNFLKTYKQLKYFFYKFLLKTYFKKIPVNSNFLYLFYRYHSFKNFDSVLF